MRSGPASRQAFWCSTTGDGIPLDARAGLAAARSRTRQGTPQYRPAAPAGRRGGGFRRLSALCTAACRMAGEPRRLRARFRCARLAFARPLCIAPVWPALGYSQLGGLLDDADRDPTRRTPRANRPVPSHSAPELPAGDRGDRRAAARFRGGRDRDGVFGPQPGTDRSAHPDRGERSRATAGAVRFRGGRSRCPPAVSGGAPVIPAPGGRDKPAAVRFGFLLQLCESATDGCTTFGAPWPDLFRPPTSCQALRQTEKGVDGRAEPGQGDRGLCGARYKPRGGYVEIGTSEGPAPRTTVVRVRA